MAVRNNGLKNESHMRNILRFSIIVGCLFFLTGCGINRDYAWRNVTRVENPGEELSSASKGYLQVYTETELPYDAGMGPELEYYWHLPYTIYTPDGKRFLSVTNHSSEPEFSEDPEIIELPPGKYVIKPSVKETKREIVGAIIKSGQTTVIHLQDN